MISLLPEPEGTGTASSRRPGRECQATMGFKEIIGHRRPIRLLQNAILNDRLPHTYLFYGPEGVGKRLTALTLAKALNCESGREDCCDQCPSCRKIEDSNHPDIVLVRPEGQFIKIDAIRELQRALAYRPYEGKRRVCILDEADRMKAESANALLKTLEEPPPDTLLILVTVEKDLLLPTILSRSQPVRFDPLPMDHIVDELVKRRSMGETEARTVAELSQRSLGRALAVLDQEVWERRPKILEALMDLPDHDVEWAFATAQSLADLGEGLDFALPMMMSWYRDLMVWKEGEEADRLINPDFLEHIRKRADRMSRRSLIRRIEAINQTSRRLDRNVNRLLAMEGLILQLR